MRPSSQFNAPRNFAANAIRTVLKKFSLPAHEEQEAYISLGDSLMAQSQYDSARAAYHVAAAVSKGGIQAFSGRQFYHSLTGYEIR